MGVIVTIHFTDDCANLVPRPCYPSNVGKGSWVWRGSSDDRPLSHGRHSVLDRYTMASMKKVLSQLIICEKSKTGESSSCVGEVPSSLVKKNSKYWTLTSSSSKKRKLMGVKWQLKKEFLTSTSLVTKYLDERLSWLSFMVLFRGENQT